MSMMGDLTYAEKADMHYMYGRANGNGRTVRYDCITHSFSIDECQITEFFSGYIVKYVRSTSPDMMLVDEELNLTLPRASKPNEHSRDLSHSIASYDLAAVDFLHHDNPPTCAGSNPQP
ncbi:hypothetical protein TNCV_498391 [Trichonephila clavipes]|nr:hypothetical protein TNCV_498391 [Trichonephila clavipes]